MSKNDLTIEVKYSCYECGLRAIAVQVPARGIEDVIQWMDATILLLGADHQRRSPHCHPEKLSDLMIPVPAGTDRVGGAPKH